MSKDKGKKEAKKAPATPTEGKKSTSDYQSSKKSVSSDLTTKAKK